MAQTLDPAHLTIGFIGYGNMAQALAEGLAAQGACDPARMYACARNAERLRANCARLGVNPCADAGEVADAADLVVVAVKPYQVQAVCEPIAQRLASKVVLSVAAGVLFDAYEGFLAPGTQHASCAPNTPVKVGAGVFVMEDTDSLTPENRTALDALLSRVGIVERVDAAHMGVAGSIAGCGPAWAYMVVEALGDAGVKHGLTRAVSYRLAAQMLAGSGRMQVETGAHPGALKDAVCSPGGTTIRGVDALEHAGMRAAFMDAVDATL